MEVLAPIALIVGGLWLIGRISRGFASHPMNTPQGRTLSAFSHRVESELLDNSAVSDDTAQEHGAFTVGEPDDFAPPMLTDIEQTPANINDSLAAIGAQKPCCSGGDHPAPAQVHAPGRPIPPVATPLLPRPAAPRKSPVLAKLFRRPPAPTRRPIVPGRSQIRFFGGGSSSGSGGSKTA